MLLLDFWSDVQFSWSNPQRHEETMPWPWPRYWTQDLGNGACHSVLLQHTPELSSSRSVSTLNGEFTVKHLVFNYFFFPPIGLVILVMSSLSLNLMFLLSPPNTLVPPHCLCPVARNPLLWIVNMALTHSREKRGGTKSRWRKTWRGDENWKGKYSSR